MPEQANKTNKWYRALMHVYSLRNSHPTIYAQNDILMIICFSINNCINFDTTILSSLVYTLDQNYTKIRKMYIK